jgi:hypothetical protein
LSEGRIHAEKLAGRSIVVEQFVLYSQEKMFSKKRCFPRNDWKISQKGSLAAKFLARIPCKNIQIHSFQDNLIFKQICD